MKRLLILLLIGCIAFVGAELTKLRIKQHIYDQMETDLLSESYEVVFVTD